MQLCRVHYAGRLWLEAIHGQISSRMPHGVCSVGPTEPGLLGPDDVQIPYFLCQA